MKKTKRQIALERADSLAQRIVDYLEIRKTISKGLERAKENEEQKQRILKIFSASETDWNDWHWQLRHRIKDVETLAKFMPMTESQKSDIGAVSRVYRFAVSPYYLSLINPDDPLDPIRLMALPTSLELDDKETDLDPMGEEYTNPAGCITRRYPDRLIMNVTNECAMYCRHCQRRRNIGETDMARPRHELEESFDYIRQNPEIRDVLVTGGDPFTMSNQRLEWILKELKKIPHVEIIRFGTRTLVTMPQRITDKLCTMLAKYHPIYVNTHFNHPQEITRESMQAADRLASAGIPMGNQAVLLNGINSDRYIMRCLNQELLKIRVRPYYLFHAKTVKGTSHFHTSIDTGVEIMEYLRGYTSGLAIPSYIINAPGGRGKTPILPEYVLSRGADNYVIRTWEGMVFEIDNHPAMQLKSFLEQKNNSDE